MDKFSKLKFKKEYSNKEDVLFSTDNLKVLKVEDWNVVKEKDLVVCIPYLIETNQIILRYEYIPTFKYVDGQEYHVTVISGGIETDETVERALLRELEEEAGIVIREDFKFESMKPLFVSKGNTNKYYPYIITLNERDYHEVIAKGDGSRAEKMSKSVKVNIKYINSLNTSDLITDYMLLKLKEYLNF